MLVFKNNSRVSPCCGNPNPNVKATPLLDFRSILLAILVQIFPLRDIIKNNRAES